MTEAGGELVEAPRKDRTLLLLFLEPDRIICLGLFGQALLPFRARSAGFLFSFPGALG